MEKREIKITDVDSKKETKPPKKRQRKQMPKKVMIYTTREKQEIFHSMNDTI